MTQVAKPINWTVVKCSLNKKNHIKTANIALATEKTIDHLPNPDQFFKAKSRNVLQIK